MRSAPPLSEYHKKRDFGITAEPKGRHTLKKKSEKLEFVIQKHGARRLHYDFRLELDGVMKSWAVTKGPSYNPADKRLAVETEDHPMDYNKFEGVIPDKQYGAGPVMIWDKGFWHPEGDPRKDYKKGHLTFTLEGQRMKGRWHLVLMRGKTEKKANWLLIKGDDDYALKEEENAGFLDRENISVVSARTLEDINKINTSKTLPYGDVELATLIDHPPSGKDWWHEIKYDGYRLLAFIQNGKVTLKTRGKKDWTHKFSKLAKDLALLKVKDAVLDGEACVLDAKGTTNFSMLQSALSDGKDEQIESWFFDLLYLNGEDYTRRPLSERKDALKKILAHQKNEASSLHYSEHFQSAPNILEKACKIGAEGIISKKKDSLYHGRRTRDWVKSKCGLEQEFIIGGFMPSKNNNQAIGSLLLGYYKGKKFIFAGKVGTGFDTKTAKAIFRRLNPLKIAQSPFVGPIENGIRGYVWVKPVQACEVSFWEWTANKSIRHASFKGLREDKEPEEIHKEVPQKIKNNTSQSQKKQFTIEGITITHPDREVYPGAGISKGDIAAYYAKVAPFMMPFAENRLISLLRCTGTIDGECFFQRAPMKGGKGNVHGLNVIHKNKKHNYMYIDQSAGLIELSQMGAIEFHGWQSKVGDVSKPDQIIFDLDPAEGIPFEAVKMAAEDIRRRLKKAGLISFPRLTGGKGIHIVAALEEKYQWDDIKNYTQNFAREMEKNSPDAYVSTMSKKKREGKIFIDYLRNDFSSTAIIPFSMRARINAPIAVPVSWLELKKIESPAHYNFYNIDAKLNKRTIKIMEDFFASRQKFPDLVG
ncbi:MAG: DNA ligase D [Micavibrio sp.]